MTLLVDEIHISSDFSKITIFQAADRMITKNGKFHSIRQKLFKISHLNACVGYYGLAQVDPNQFLSEWLKNFIYHANAVTTIEEFSHLLCDSLNRNVNKRILSNNPSGFHICGFNDKKFPEFWHVRNIVNMEGNIYTKWNNKYNINEDLLSQFPRDPQDASKLLPIPNNSTYYFINGDVRPFHSTWLRLDKFINEMVSQDVIKQPQKIGDIEKVIKWKMSVISSFYKNFATKGNIGNPIDVFSLVP